MNSKTKITVAYGDGIGPEIMKATLAILDAAGAQLEYEVIEIGEKVYLKGISSGMEPNAIDSLRANKVFLKSPITTPQGGGFKSLNVTTRKSFGLYANVRPCKAYSPFIKTHFPKTDLVIIRENEEDLYAGIEHRQTQEVYQCLKVISQPGSEKIIRYAFEYAKKYGRKKVTCMTKDNIMKLADGLFHKTFLEIAKEYPGIETDHKIIDIGTALIADRPEIFDVIVTLNLYGDIISDVAAQVTGSVGLGGSANVGAEVAMFEAIHGSAPDIAGKDIANPSGLLNGAIMMLVHIGQHEIAAGQIGCRPVRQINRLPQSPLQQCAGLRTGNGQLGPALGHRDHPHIPSRMMDLMAEIEMVHHRHRLCGCGGDQKMLLAQPCHRAVIHHEAVFAQHQAVTGAAHRQGRDQIAIDKIQKGGGIAALYLDFAERRDIA